MALLSSRRKTLRPVVYSRQASGIPYRSDASWGQGSIDRVFALTFHHSAGARAKTYDQAVSLNRAYDQQHQNQGWGGIGYHFMMDDLGRIYRGRPNHLKGAHTGGHNTGNIGIMIHGNYDHDKLTARQKQTIEWLFKGGIAELTGVPERRILMARGHQEWPGPTNATACPGRDIMRSLVFRRNKDLN